MQVGRNRTMIGMDFISFLILLVISVVVSGILHHGLNDYVTPGFWSFCSKVAVGWAGAWIGSPVFGHWPADFHYEDIWFIPAGLGAAGGIIVAPYLRMVAPTPRGEARVSQCGRSRVAPTACAL